MALTCNFVDNEVYGAHDINSIRGTLAYKGVIPETASSCQAVKQGSVYKVLAGQALFEDGSVAVVDQDGAVFEVTAGVRQYVWFERSDAFNNVSLKCTTTAPSGLFVKLAEIETGGSVIDRREYGRMKIPTYESVVSGSRYTDYNKSGVAVSVLPAPGAWRLAESIPMTVDFKCAAIYISGEILQPLVNFLPTAGSAAVTDVAELAVWWWAKGSTSTANGTTVGIRKNGTNMEVWVCSNTHAIPGGVSINFQGIYFV